MLARPFPLVLVACIVFCLGLHADARPTSTRADQTEKHWVIGARFGGIYSTPISDWYDDFKSGRGVETEVMLPIADRLILRFLASKSGIQPRGTVYFDNTPVDGDSVDVDIYRFYLSLGFYQTTNRNKPNHFSHFYAHGGLGTAMHFITYVNTDSKVSKFALTFATGYVHMFTEAVGVDLSGSFDFLGMSDTNNPLFHSETLEYAYLLDFRVGLVFMLLGR